MPGIVNQKAATILSSAELLAADLAGAGIDPNEAQKALAYLRSKRDPKAFFDYLQAIVTNGQAVIRSRQTLDYYRNLQDACQRHLRGMAYEEMALTLGWALRLLRYYRAVPWAAEERAAERRAPRQAPRQAAAAEAGTATSAPPQPAPRAAAPALPQTPQLPRDFAMALSKSNAGSLPNLVNRWRQLPDAIRPIAARAMIDHARTIKVKDLEKKPWYQELLAAIEGQQA